MEDWLVPDVHTEHDMWLPPITSEVTFADEQAEQIAGFKRIDFRAAHV
jgi:hypothetical protein